MRINIYSQELLTDPRGGEPLTGSHYYHDVVELVEQTANTGVTYTAVRMFLRSSEHLHHPPTDDDRSALTLWLPKSRDRRVQLAGTLQRLAEMVLEAKPETGLD